MRRWTGALLAVLTTLLLAVVTAVPAQALTYHWMSCTSAAYGASTFMDAGPGGYSSKPELIRNQSGSWKTFQYYVWNGSTYVRWGTIYGAGHNGVVSVGSAFGWAFYQHWYLRVSDGHTCRSYYV